MKFFLLGCVLMMTTVSSYGFSEKKDRFCQSVAGLSESIMKARQHGADATKAMNVFKDEKDKATREMMQELVISAYKKPRYSSQPYIDKAVLDYKNEVYVTCITS